jgi:hypothetical protein
MVKMNPTAAASSLWTMMATLKIQPGSQRAKNVETRGGGRRRR